MKANIFLLVCQDLHPNPYLRILRSQLEQYIIEELGESQM